jgi:hypothetical protein
MLIFDGPPGHGRGQESTAGKQSSGQLQGVAQGVAAIRGMAVEVDRHRMAIGRQG